MPVAEGFVIHEHEVEGSRDGGDTAEVRTVIDASRGCEHLEQRVIRFAPGRSAERLADSRQEVLFVVSGRGTLHLQDEPHQLEPQTGAFVASGERYAVENPGPEELLIVSVTAPQSDRGTGADRRVTVRHAEQPALPASPDREFRYLVNQDAGCLDVTQFVGVIPPSNAPQHSHSHDEVVYVIEGEGFYHVGDGAFPIAPGSCLHVPPFLMHSLENTGEADMRVLGVFHPSGDPASRADVDNK